ncbi:MAG: restriction endonuclease [Campylobacter sp.]|nr:restriction endonuclease [Campylobacter sp.]
MILKKRLKHRVFSADLNYQILKTVIQNPHRYTGLFRITNAKTKLIQNLTQSCEIKFGDFLEEILTKYIEIMGYENLPKNLGQNENNEFLNADQIFKKEAQIYLIEQKIRDDHDSTKKRGQYLNFTKKIKLLKKRYPSQKIIATMWFSDDSLKKNRNFYLEQINFNTDDRVKIYLNYGKEIFENLFERVDIWDELISHLKEYKIKKSKEILSVPDFDESDEIKNTLMQMQENESKLIKKLLSDKKEYVDLRNELFPSGKNLQGLK